MLCTLHEPLVTKSLPLTPGSECSISENVAVKLPVRPPEKNVPLVQLSVPGTFNKRPVWFIVPVKVQSGVEITHVPAAELGSQKPMLRLIELLVTAVGKMRYVVPEVVLAGLLAEHCALFRDSMIARYAVPPVINMRKVALEMVSGVYSGCRVICLTTDEPR